VSTGGGIVLSRKGVRNAATQRELEDAYRAGLSVEGKVEKAVKGGYEVRIARERAFCPLSQIDITRTEDPAVHEDATTLMPSSEASEDPADTGGADAGTGLEEPTGAHIAADHESEEMLIDDADEPAAEVEQEEPAAEEHQILDEPASEAAEEFEALCKLTPDAPGAHQALGNVYQTMGVNDRAAEEMKRAQALTPASATATSK